MLLEHIVSVADYAAYTFQTNNLTIAPNGSEKIGGVAAAQSLSTEGQSVTFVYVDGTQGWKNVQDSTSNVTGNPYVYKQQVVQLQLVVIAKFILLQVQEVLW